MRPGPALVLLSLVIGPLAHAADARFTFLGKQLEKATDPRGRAQAALLLGQTQDPAALPMLCKALSDRDDVVRAASAKALQALGELSAIDCLKTAEQNPSVKSALAALEAVKNQPPRVYIALQKTDNRANLPADELKLLEDRIRAKLARIGALIAPPDESKAAAQKILKAKKLKGFLLMTTVDAVGPGLSVTLVCFSYPEKVLKGQVSVKAGGAAPPELIKALAPKAVEDAADEFEWND